MRRSSRAAGRDGRLRLGGAQDPATASTGAGGAAHPGRAGRQGRAALEDGTCLELRECLARASKMASEVRGEDVGARIVLQLGR
jgi:hypothetical protein